MCALFAAPRTARGVTPPKNWLRDHLSADLAAVVGWRSAWVNGPHSGFNLLGGGGELNLGLEFSGGYSVHAGARVLSGAASAPSGLGLSGADNLSFLEATGQLGGQIELTDWVRVELGASAGRIWRCCATPPAVVTPLTYDALSLVAGGYLRLGVDWLPREGLLIHALSLWLRLDVDGHPRDETDTLPSVSMALALSVGIRL